MEWVSSKALLRVRIFRHPIIANPDNVDTYTKAEIALHNFLRCTEPGIYSPSGSVDGEGGEGNIIRGSWRQDDEPLGIQPVGMTSSNRLILSTLVHVSFFNCSCELFAGTHNLQLRLEIYLRTISTVLLERCLGSIIT